MIELKLLRKLNNEPYSEFKKIKSITVFELKKMYSIYEKYYENTQYSIFEEDFLNKTGVFLIRSPKNNEIVGFSTILERNFHVNGKVNYAFFSGDTVIEKKYWGSRALQRAMNRYVIHFKVSHPTKPVYWMLISKGFKTYLLLANNYCTYYPNIEKKHAHLKNYVESYCQQYYADFFNAETGLLDFGLDYQALKQSIAPITDELKSNNPKIAYFELCNPTWEKGTELPCIGEMKWEYLLKASLRLMSKKMSKGSLDSKVKQAEPIFQTITNKAA